MPRRMIWAAGLAGLLGSTCLYTDARAQIAVSSNDGKGVLVNGVNTVPDDPVPDNIVVIDLGASPPKVLAEVKMPTSLVGPPSSVAVSADGSYALVTAATKIDPNDKKKVAPHNIVSVVDLKASPPAVIATHETGTGASGVAINKAGTLALVANRLEGTVSVFTISGKTLTPAGKVTLGDAKSQPAAVAFTPDGKRALVTRDGDSKVSVLTINGNTVEASKRDIHGGLRAYPLGISPNGDWAAFGNVGMGNGDSDTVSLIDLKADPPRVVDTITVGQTPEGLVVAPDGKHMVVTVINGSSKPPGSPFRNDHGLAVVLATDGKKLSKVAEGNSGTWCQGAAWSRDSKTVLVQCMLEQEIQVFAFDGKGLTRTGAIKVSGGPSGFGTSQ
ncbi:MAG: YncE family protein [Acetobacteraceae bacterium]